MTRAIWPPLNDEERVRFVAAARDMIGVRWKHQGRSRRGIDCGGLLVWCIQTVDRIAYDPKGYTRLPYRHSLEATLQQNMGNPLEPGEIRYGDVAVFAWNSVDPNHCGIVGDYVHGGLSLIHAFAINGEVVESPIDVSMTSMLREVYRP